MKSLSAVEHEAAIEELRDAQHKLIKVIEALKSVAQITGDHAWDRTIIVPLEQAANVAHPWAGDHDTIAEWIRVLEIDAPVEDDMQTQDWVAAGILESDVCEECGGVVEITGNTLCVTCNHEYEQREEERRVAYHKQMSELEALAPTDEIMRIVRDSSNIIFGTKALREEYGLSLRGAKLTYEWSIEQIESEKESKVDEKPAPEVKSQPFNLLSPWGASEIKRVNELHSGSSEDESKLKDKGDGN